MTVIVTCIGPGPHIPDSGVLGESLSPVPFARCPSPACIDPAASNQTTLQLRAQTALTANASAVAAAKPGTAAAQASAAYDNSVTALRECSVIIRLLLGLLDSTAGT